jgi:two-component system, OmpR family, sensor kinase
VSLRARLLVGVAVVAIVLGVVAVTVTRATESYLVDRVDAQLTSAVPRFGGDHFPGGGGGGGGENLSSLYVGVVNSDGTVDTVSRPNLSDDNAPLPAMTVRQLEAAKPGHPFTVGSQPSGSRYRVLTTRDDRSGRTLVVGLPLSDVDASVDRLVTVEAIGTLGVIGILGLVTFWVLRLGVRPIKQMTATATAIAAGDLSHRVPVAPAGTEAGELGTALNTMLGDIERAFAQQATTEDRLRRFVADASHELRTPVTTIRGYAELYRSGGLTDEADLAQAMRRTEQESIRMGSLIEDLLLLARLDEGRPLERAPVDLATLALDAVADAGAVSPGRPVSADVDGPVAVLGDEMRLRQVVGNLVGNALAHTPLEAALTVRARQVDGQAVLEVSDAGPGMSPDVAAHAFERFYRSDPSRSRRQGGAGLGLSIVYAIVQAHGGTVTLDSALGEGTTVRVELPVADFAR